MKGWIYIATNEEIPNLVKVGKTENDPDERAKQLSSPTGVPGETRIVYSAWVDNDHDVERGVLNDLDERKVTKTGEWIRGEIDYVISVLKTVIKSSSGNLIFEENRLAPVSAQNKKSRIVVRCPDCDAENQINLPFTGRAVCNWCFTPLLVASAYLYVSASNSDSRPNELSKSGLDQYRIEKLEDVCNSQSKDLLEKDGEIASLEEEIKALENKIKSITPKTFVVCGGCGTVTQEHVDLDEENEDSERDFLEEFQCGHCGVYIGDLIVEPSS